MRKIFILLSAILWTLSSSALNIRTDSIKTCQKNWLYFGWEEDHPKALSLMGGGLYSRRPILAKNDDHSWECSKEPWHKDCDKLLFFMVSVDGTDPYYPDENTPTRRKDIQWRLAERSLPFPVSTWEHQGITMEITHVGRRLLDNTLNAIYTNVQLTNTDNVAHEVSLIVCGVSAPERCLPLKKYKLTSDDNAIVTKAIRIAPRKSVTFEFVEPANGNTDKETVLAQGDFTANYKAEKARIETRMGGLTMPVSLPDERYIDLWKASLCHMWNATVKKENDYELRGSGGNPWGAYQYDRVFDHDEPDMVIENIIEGDWGIARQVMKGDVYKRLSEGKLFKEAYLDAVPKYMITFAQYLMLTGDKAYFNAEMMEKLKNCSRAVQHMREFSDEARAKGVFGLMKKGNTLDNGGKTYLLVDNFAALHGFAAYKYLCEKLGQSEEASWADTQIKDLNDCLNAAIRKSVKEGGYNWYNACFSFNMDYNLVSGPGNWLGTTFMMPTFPWNAQLKGFNLGGEWMEYLDNSVEKWLETARFYGAPKGSFGAWWGAKYGAAYNAGMGQQLLASEKYRTIVKESIDWLLDNQTAPLIWAESFHKPDYEGDWTKPEVDHETWALGFIRQTMLQMCVSVKADSDVIIGRGLPNEWIESGKKTAWERVHITDGKTIDLSIQKVDSAIEVTIDGDTNTGNYLIDIPYCVGKIKDVIVDGGSVVTMDFAMGKVTVTGGSKKISIKL